MNASELNRLNNITAFSGRQMELDEGVAATVLLIF